MYASLPIYSILLQDCLHTTGSRIRQSIAERLLQLLVNVGLRAVQWEAGLREGNLTMTKLSFEISEVADLLAFTSRVVTAINGSSDDVHATMNQMDTKEVLGTESRKALSSLMEAAFEPMAQSVADLLLHGLSDESSMKGSLSIPAILGSFEVDIYETGRMVSLAKSLGLDPCSVRGEAVAQMEQKPSLLMDPLFAAIVIPQARQSINKLLLDTVVQSGLFLGEVALFQDYFLLYKADWIIDLLDNSLSQLEKPVKLVNRSAVSRMVKQFTEGLMTSQFDVFPLEELNLENRTSDDSMVAIKALTLTKVVRPDLQCIFTEPVLGKYQAIFRNLVYGQYTDYKLKEIWKEFKALRRVDRDDRLFACHLLLRDMIHFLHNYMLYLSMDVIGSKDWKFSTSREVSITAIHSALDTMLSQIVNESNLCGKVNRTVSKILATCTLFSTHMTRFIRMNLQTGGSTQEHERTLIEATSQKQYITMVQKFSDSFRTHTNNLFVELKADKSNPSSPALLGRLDFNGFYRDRMGIQ